MLSLFAFKVTGTSWFHTARIREVPLYLAKSTIIQFAIMLEKKFFFPRKNNETTLKGSTITLGHLPDLHDMTLKGGIAILYPYHGHLPGIWNTHNNVCTVSKRSSLTSHRLESICICRISQNSHLKRSGSNYKFTLHFLYAL